MKYTFKKSPYNTVKLLSEVREGMISSNLYQFYAQHSVEIKFVSLSFYAFSVSHDSVHMLMQYIFKFRIAYLKVAGNSWTRAVDVFRLR